MNDKDKLAELFRKFPGIGPRQAKRMVYHLLTEEKDVVKDISKLIASIQENIQICELCFRYFEKNKNNSNKVCSTCLDPHRDQSTMMIVSRDVDFETIEKSGVYKGVYFVLGGTIPFLSKNPTGNIRLKELVKVTLPNRLVGGLKEIILALNANPEGENTANIVESKIKEIGQANSNSSGQVKITKLGRGFSTGTEVEYSDKETLKNAISSRFLS